MKQRALILTLTALFTLPLFADGATNAAQIERGRYLVTFAMCNDCHTPFKMGEAGPEPDMSRMLSGHPQNLAVTAPKLPDTFWVWAGGATNTAFAGPWGVSFSANLTPDKETGLGSWNAKMFRDTLRNGRHMGVGRPLLPPMPYKFIGTATDEDLDAIFAYLQSIPAIPNRVPQPIEPSAE